MNKTKGVHVTWHGTIVSPDGTEIALGQSNWFPNISLETLEALQRAEAAIARFVEAENEHLLKRRL
jgi:hypothetical protein